MRYEPRLVDRPPRRSGGRAGPAAAAGVHPHRAVARRQGVLSHAAYDELGGVRQVLARHAERVWALRLDEEERTAARGLLSQLVHPRDGQIAPSRRTVARCELTDRQWRSAQRLLHTRLVPGQDRQQPDGTRERN